MSVYPSDPANQPNPQNNPNPPYHPNLSYQTPSTYHPNPAYQSNPAYQTHPAYPPVGAYQPNPGAYQGPPVMSVVVPQPQPTYENFDKKQAKLFAIALLVLGIINLIVTGIVLFAYLLFTWAFTYVLVGLLAGSVPIIAGVLGIVASKQPSSGKICAFMVLSFISTVIDASMIILLILVYIYLAFPIIPVIIGIIFYIVLLVVSFTCCVLGCKAGNCSLTADSAGFEI